MEVTMEANPTSVEASKFESLSKSGVNRVSLGIQSLDQDQLKFLGRTHSVTEAKGAIELAAKHFPRYSFDLIYALPNQTEKQWSQQLQEALKLANGHLSLYQLTIEKGTEFFKAHRDGQIQMPDSELAASMYQLTESVVGSHGYNAYEISNYARIGQECLHNMQYWRYGDYLGIGPGAHGRIMTGGDKYGIQNISSPEIWLAKVHKDGVGVQQKENISEASQIVEALLMGLRTYEGVPITLIPDLHKAHMLVENGFLVMRGERIAATMEGRLVLNSVIRELIL